MSRIGKQPIKIPQNVSIAVEANEIVVTGPKGTLKQFAMPCLSVKQEGDSLIVTRSNDERTVRTQHGLMRSLINNMVQGVSQGFTKKLELNGVGFRVALSGTDMHFNLGFSHEVIYKIPDGVTINLEQNVITITGISKQQVGQVAAEIRALKKPEPYKGKGIKYVGERIIRKSGKSGKEKVNG
jgi:large subunit ribosomal protein L6